MVRDPRGDVRLTGELHEVAGASGAALIVHGLGGSAESGYCRRMAAAATRYGLTALRLNLRGADREGEDLYHAGLTADLEAALESPELAGYERHYVAGFSLGGHVTLRLAAQPTPKLRAVAALCAPLDLSASCDFIDRADRYVYRQFLLGALREIHGAVAARRNTPLAVADARRVRSIRRWDHLTIAPRFGFNSAEDYYRRESASHVLGDLRVPALYLASRADPMVAPHTVERHLRGARLDVQWVEGGHVGFPARVAAEDRVLSWLLRN